MLQWRMCMCTCNMHMCMHMYMYVCMVLASLGRMHGRMPHGNQALALRGD